MTCTVGEASFVPGSDRDLVRDLLRRQLAYDAERSGLYREVFAEAGLTPDAIGEPEDIARFPFTTKQQLRDSQATTPPLGAHAAATMTDVVRLHASTGTTGNPSWVGVTRADADRWTHAVANAFANMGCAREDVVVHGSGLTLFVGGLPIRDAIEHIGAAFVPIGTGASEKAVQAMRTLGVTALHSTPSYARYLAEYVRDRGGDPRAFGLKKIFVGGEPGGGEPALRAHLESEWGAPVTEGLGNADMLPVIFSERPGTGGMRLTAPHDVLVELVDPESGDPVAPEPGATGELVYTSLNRECCPLVRFRTRDHVRVTGLDDDGAPLIRCFGRTDDMLIVLGVNVFPTAIRDLVQEFRPRASEVMQVVVPGGGPKVDPPLRLEVEPGPEPGEEAELRTELERAIRDRLSVRAEVTLVPRGSLERAEMKTRLTRVT